MKAKVSSKDLTKWGCIKELVEVSGPHSDHASDLSPSPQREEN